MPNEPRPAEFRLTLTYALVLAVVVAAYKVVPRYLPLDTLAWNLVPLGALALFFGSRLRTRFAVLLPLVTSLLADVLLIPAVRDAGYSSIDLSTPFTYAGFLVYFGLGRLIPEKQTSPLPILGAGLAGSALFFLISNFGSWVASPLYARSWDGLMECYALGVPFYRNTMLSDLVFPAVFFGVHAALVWTTSPREVEQAV